jgi:CHAT domain-containing protein
LGRDSSASDDRDAFLRERSRLLESLERTRTEYARVVTSTDERATDTRVLAGGTPTRLADVRASLRAGEALLEYFQFPDRLQWFVITRERMATAAHPIDRTALATRVRLVRELTGRLGSATVIPALEALHDDLLGDVRRSGALDGVRTLVYVPHGALEYVPFAALRDRRTGRYVVEDFDLLHAPAAAVLPVLRSRPARGAGSQGAVAFAPFPGALPGSAVEGEAIRREMPGSRSVSGPAATEARVREALAGGGIVHMATHGVLSARNPLFSRIELAPGRSDGGPEDDGRLEVHEVHRMPIGAWLAFLSGCETGLGASGATGMSTGEDYATLVRAFLSGGAANVIATLWRVEDQGSAELTRAFYRQLSAAASSGDARGERGLARALSGAQRELLRDPRWSSPFYWAGFRLTGTG